MKILPKDIFENIANSFNLDEQIVFVDTIDFEPDCKIYKLKNKSDDNFILICRDYQFDDSTAEARILDAELSIAILDEIKCDDGYFIRKTEFDDFEYVFSLKQIL